MKALAQNTLIQNRYLIVQLIGKGGMGEVYLAVDQRLGSAVALKRTFFAGDEMLGNAFEREARTLARMRHPVLPKVSDHFGENEEQYLVMEHISGDDLAKRLDIAQKPFPISWVLFWADQLLDALSYLHSHEPPIIHRDIKPQNLKLTDENHIILLDFGLSKTSTGQTNLSDHGSTGSVVGYTPHYASMEQIRGIGTSARSDLYSLSATLYQLLTNTVPADALSRADSMLNEMPDPIKQLNQLNPEIPPGVSEVILKGMEVSQEKRYANAREMQKVLRKAFTEMEQATKVETVAFNLHTEKMSAIDQPAGVFAQSEGLLVDNKAKPSITGYSQPQNSFGSGNFSNKDEPDTPDFDATLAFDSQTDQSPVKQSDITTQVFNAEGISVPIPERQIPLKAGLSRNAISSPPDDIFEAGGSFTASEFDSNPANFNPNATIPYFAREGGSPDVKSGGFDSPKIYDENAAGENRFSTTVTPYFETPQAEGDLRADVNGSRVRPVLAPPTEKKSSSTFFALIGGLAALLILGSFAGAAAYYYFNYYAAATVSPVPTPAVTPESLPSPVPTFESSGSSDTDIPGSESDTNTNLNTSTNTGQGNTAEETKSVQQQSSPTPAPARPAQIPARNTSSRPPGTGGEKQAPKPKPKPTDDRTKILQ